MLYYGKYWGLLNTPNIPEGICRNALNETHLCIQAYLCQLFVSIHIQTYSSTFQTLLLEISKPLLHIIRGCMVCLAYSYKQTEIYLSLQCMSGVCISICFCGWRKQGRNAEQQIDGMDWRIIRSRAEQLQVVPCCCLLA